MAEAFVGEIRLVAFNFAPEGWLLCAGQELAVNQYMALYALIGNTYGGNGTVTFKLPDLRGRVATQCGQGPVGTTVFGQTGGTTGAVVNTASSLRITSMNQLPAHTHDATFTGTGGGEAVQPTIALKVSNDTATSATPIADGYIGGLKGAGLAAPSSAYVGTASTGTTTLNQNAAVASGGSGGGITGGTVSVASAGAQSPEAIPFPISFNVPPAMSPFIAMNYVICVNGIFPPRP